MTLLTSSAWIPGIGLLLLLWLVVLWLVIMLVKRVRSKAAVRLQTESPAKVGVSLEATDDALKERDRLKNIALEALREWGKWESRMPENDHEQEQKGAAWDKYIKAFQDAFAAEERANAAMKQEFREAQDESAGKIELACSP